MGMGNNLKIQICACLQPVKGILPGLLPFQNLAFHILQVGGSHIDARMNEFLR
jgi:hypothetical protein